MKIAICDDEQIFRDQIKKCISRTGIDYSTDEFLCGEDLLGSTEKYDIVFLDIDMPGISGIQTAEKLRELGTESEIIFLTSHVEFVYEAFKVRAFRFLKKPVDPETFSEAFLNAVKNCEKEKIVIEYKGAVTELNVENIAYIEASGEGTFVYDNKGSYTQSPVSMKEWTERLKDKYFFRIHKTYLISMNYVASYEKNTVQLIGFKDPFPIARRSVSEFRTVYLEFIKNNARMM